jgi:hypothetical protein
LRSKGRGVFETGAAEAVEKRRMEDEKGGRPNKRAELWNNNRTNQEEKRISMQYVI